MLQDQDDGLPTPPTVSTLKRHEPPSPSSSSSPKRAASEDATSALSSADAPTASSLLPHLAPPLYPSSPLRMDCDDEAESTGWVDRTGQVSLGSEDDATTPGGDGSKRGELREVYDAVLGSVPPPFITGAVYYLLPKQFFSNLKNFVFSDDGDAPLLDLSPLTDPSGSIPVTTLTDGDIEFWPLRQGLVEDEDFIYISASGWQTLTKAFNYPSTSPALPRLCLPDGRVEIAPNVYLLHIVVTNPAIPVPPAAPVPPRLIMAPSSTVLKKVREFVRQLLGNAIPVGNPFRLWAVDPEEPLSTLEVSAQDMPSLRAKLIRTNDTLALLGLANNDSLVVELQGPSNIYPVNSDTDGNAVDKITPLFTKPAFYSGSGEASSSQSLLALNRPQTRSQSRVGRGKGLVGLNNLGNTCFLASATQCLSNTHVLAEYFLSGVYRDELNPDNPLGMDGQVAEAFGEVVENLWTSSPQSSFSPRRLKATCSRFAPQFAGYGQHDTQEFLAFLLDGLHEDLNRIKKKPYIEKPDWKPGGGDRELAELGKECWEGYKKRNDSVIVDLFQGQLQSTLVCPECHKESITMDPFMYLTVPLPISQTRAFKLVFFPVDVEKPPVRVELLVPVNASFSTLKDKLGALVKAQGNHIVGFDYWKHSIYAWWLDSDPNSEAKDVDVCVFHELAVPASSTHRGVGTAVSDDSVTVPVYTFRPDNQPRSSFHHGSSVPSECSLEPFFITLSRAEACDPAAVRMAIVKGYSRLVRPEKQSELFVAPNAPQAIEVDDEDDAHIEHAEEENPAAPSSVSRSQSSVSLAAAGSLVARAGLFKVHVADASSADQSSGHFFKSKDPNIQPLYRGTPSGASGSWSSLDKRKGAKRPMMQRISSSISNLVSSAANSDDEDDSAATSSAPVVRPGEGIFVEWSPNTFDEFFEENRDNLARNLESVVDPAIAKDVAKKRAGRSISLDDCLDEFSKEETLGQDDLWYCPQCKKHQAATKKLDIYKAPDILVICLKRFGSSRTMRDKLDQLVNFPIDGLDLDERIGERRISKTLELTDEEAKHYGIEHSTEPFIYDLYAVDNHFGGLGGGHYTAFCRNHLDDQWYNYDDSRVSKASADSVQSRAAYLLFYKRRTARPIGGISRIKAEEASRAATPMPSIPNSPVIGPSVPSSAMASAMPSGPCTPTQPSPVLSAGSSMDSTEAEPEELPGYDFTSARSLGFGNVAWGVTPGHLPTPEASDDGFVPVGNSTASLKPEDAHMSAHGGETGLGEEYNLVPSEGSSEAEMVSVPRSPTSEA